MTKDLELIKNNMLYNYRYKMQESLRKLCTEFATDISGMNMELNVLLEHVKRSHQSENGVCVTPGFCPMTMCLLSENSFCRTDERQ